MKSIEILREFYELGLLADFSDPLIYSGATTSGAATQGVGIWLSPVGSNGLNSKTARP